MPISSDVLLLGFQVVIVQFGGEAFGTTPLTPTQFAACVGIGAMSWIVRAALRYIPPHHVPYSNAESRTPPS